MITLSENDPIAVIGSGLAGSECAYQLAKRGNKVLLIEMRPQKMTPAHHTASPAELVCSNSFRSLDVMNAVGLLKEEMASLDSLIMRAAYKARVPAGSALAVDREVFSNFVDEKLKSFPQIKKINGEVIAFEKSAAGLKLFLANDISYVVKAAVVATGPLTSEPLSQWISEQAGQQHLYFYDSIAPIVDFDSINLNIAFRASRYGKGDEGEGDYINCPLDENQYANFISAIQNAEIVPVKDFDKAQFFEGCLPIEEMVARGPKTLRFGPMKPVGITSPHKPLDKPHAVVQLRQDNLHASLYNMVGFQTRLKWGEQKRIFQMIPGLEKAEFVRLGSMHRNTYLCAPRLLNDDFSFKNWPALHFAGQITGCEGYAESTAIGLIVGCLLAKKNHSPFSLPPPTTALGALIYHVLKADSDHYQPMNINFGLFAPLEINQKRADKKVEQVRRASHDFRKWIYDYFE